MKLLNNNNFFSKQTIGILEDLKAQYGTFDILTDDEVRQVRNSKDLE